VQDARLCAIIAGRVAREAGLEPLAEALLARPDQSPEEVARRYVEASKGVIDSAAALDGARAVPSPFGPAGLARGSPEGARHVRPYSMLRSERSTGLAFPRSFQCKHCGVAVSTDAPGTSHRNHCPSCLWSAHLDRNAPGDRDAKCSGGMEPIAVTVRGEGRWVLIHRCTNCGRLRLNRTAGDDNAIDDAAKRGPQTGP